MARYGHAIPSSHQRQIRNAWEQRQRTQEQADRQDEILAAKQIQAQTGCTWTEALRAAYTRTKA